MSARIADSAAYAHLWGTAETRALFEESARIQSWLEILAALARAQAAEGLMPQRAADLIGAEAQVDRLELDRIAEGTRATGHSTLGLIRELKRVLSPEAAEHIYVGATVQDVTDTWTALVMRSVGGIVWRDLRALEAVLLELAVRHRDDLIAGRTHGQPGRPTTFGWKVASWADEVRRHLNRLGEGAPRWLVGQLGGGIGTLDAFDGKGLEVRSRFCADLGLHDPVISWLTARDRVAEFSFVMTAVAGTLARIGNEVYELQRPEIGELSEARSGGVVGSITMGHKRNPEGSEHLDTLARLARAQHGVLMESMVGVHERDGRSWKAEWIAFPEVCLMTTMSTELALSLAESLEVHTAQMARNVTTFLSAADNSTDPGAANEIVNLVVERAYRARAQEGESWP